MARNSPCMRRIAVVVGVILGLFFFVVSSQSTFASLGSSSSGSGVIVGTEGYILTNYHVVNGASSLIVTLFSGKHYPAKVIAIQPDRDLALIKIDLRNLSALPVNRDRLIQQGESVVSIGSPQGLVGTISQGIITFVGRDVESLGLEDLYQTNAGIAHGSSGGPLIDVYGTVIGINVCVRTSGREQVPLTEFGFAVPISYAKDLLARVPAAALPVPQAMAASARQAMNEPLSVPELAARCSSAGVYIVNVQEVALTELLPDALSGFDLGKPTSLAKSPPISDQKFGGIAPMSPFSTNSLQMPTLNTNPFSLPSNYFILPGGLNTTDTRLGEDPEECVYIKGDQDLGSDGDYGVQVLLALFDDSAAAATAASCVRNKDMGGLQSIGDGTYRIGDFAFEVTIGFVQAEKYSCSGLDFIPEEMYSTCDSADDERAFARVQLPQSQWDPLQTTNYNTYGVRIRETGTLVLDELLVVVSLSWSHRVSFGTKALILSLTGGTTTKSAEYEYQNSCVRYTRTEGKSATRYFDSTRGKYVSRNDAKHTEDTRILICMDEFEDEFTTLLQSVLSAIGNAL